MQNCKDSLDKNMKICCAFKIKIRILIWGCRWNASATFTKNWRFRNGLKRFLVRRFSMESCLMRTLSTTGWCCARWWTHSHLEVSPKLSLQAHSTSNKWRTSQGTREGSFLFVVSKGYKIKYVLGFKRPCWSMEWMRMTFFRQTTCLKSETWPQSPTPFMQWQER